MRKTARGGGVRRKRICHATGILLAREPLRIATSHQRMVFHH
jgi:hypothetical protein